MKSFRKISITGGGRRLAWVLGAFSSCWIPLWASSPEVAKTHASWGAYLGATDSAQYSSLTQINRDNVAQLERVWSYPSGDEGYTAGPIVIDGVMYVIAKGGIAAIDAASGREIWFAAGFVHRARGLAYWESSDERDRRILFPKDNCLMALDARTGEPIMTFGKKGCTDLRENLGRDPASIKTIASATPGRVFENLIILGSATGESYDGPPGDVRAYDVRSGRMVWTFHTIPHPGELGYDTWPKDAWKTSGGNNVWGEMSLDEPRGIVFLSIGSPDYNFYGADRKGDNLFGNCLVALDARTGKRLWHFQAIHHDLWDYNIAMAPKLLTLRQNGRAIDAVAVVPKTGLIYVFDRVTGRPLFPIEERAVPQSDVPGEMASATQPFPRLPPPLSRMSFTEKDINPYLDTEERKTIAERIRAARNEGIYTPPAIDREVILMPGNFGGAQHGNGAAIPGESKFFMVSLELPAILKLERKVPRAYRTPTERLFGENCALCHGANAAGQPSGAPSLIGIGARLDSREFYRTVHDGRARMPGLAFITEEQAKALWELLSATDDTGPRMSQTSGEVPVTAAGGAVRYFTDHYATAVSKNGLPIISPPWATLSAYDLDRGALMWRKSFGDAPQLADKGVRNTGAIWPTDSIVATAGGLLFSATTDKKLRAWDQETGAVLWETSLAASSRALPAIYEVGGRQFLVVAATSRDNEKQADGVWREVEPQPGSLSYVAYALPEKSS